LSKLYHEFKASINRNCSEVNIPLKRDAGEILLQGALGVSPKIKSPNYGGLRGLDNYYLKISIE